MTRDIDVKAINNCVAAIPGLRDLLEIYDDENSEEHRATLLCIQLLFAEANDIIAAQKVYGGRDVADIDGTP